MNYFIKRKNGEANEKEEEEEEEVPTSAKNDTNKTSAGGFPVVNSNGSSNCSNGSKMSPMRMGTSSSAASAASSLKGAAAEDDGYPYLPHHHHQQQLLLDRQQRADSDDMFDYDYDYGPCDDDYGYERFRAEEEYPGEADEGGEEDEDATTADNSAAAAEQHDRPLTDSSDPLCLEGFLHCRRGRGSFTGHSAGGMAFPMWKRRFVELSLTDGGAVKIYKKNRGRGCSDGRTGNQVQASSGLLAESGGPATGLRTVYSKLHELSSSMISAGEPRDAAAGTRQQQEEEEEEGSAGDHDSRVIRETNSSADIELFIPTYLPWVARDVNDSSSNFVIEIPTSATATTASGGSDDSSGGGGDGGGDLRRRFSCDRPGSPVPSSTFGSFDDLEDLDRNAVTDDRDPNYEDYRSHQGSEEGLPSESLAIDAAGNNGNKISVTTSFEGDAVLEAALEGELENARKRGRPLRVYFKCAKGTNEKALWLQAFSRLNRLSSDARKKKGLLGSLASYGVKHTRVRRQSLRNIARDVRQLELADEDIDAQSVDVLNYSVNDVEELVRGGRINSKLLRDKDKEYRVQPTYAYPHRWMTRREMREEMILPSETFHDLRVPGGLGSKKEIGSLRIEVLQCLGLPKLDRTAETDAIVYMVCGSYAFATDVIPGRSNPMWLRKARRACEIPLFNAYARLYVGVFDDDNKRVKDEFAGRVVINLPRLRPRSTYDVTLPLRLSSTVYSRRRRGAVRLRFSVRWTTERDALMSYIPKKIRIPLPQNTKPNLDTTVLCSDQKAFRNIAITIHGANLPGKFTFQQMRAAIREINFTRKYIFTSLRMWFKETRHWEFPAVSAFIFLAWMHCVYENQFSLVPAYLVLYFVLQLMCNYAKYGIDGPGNRGFVPPSWEEMFAALVRGRDPDYRAIEPLEMGLRPLPLTRRRTPESSTELFDDAGPSDYMVSTHVPRGKALFRALGFLDKQNDFSLAAEENHLEFPFAKGADYPKFTVKDSLVLRNGDVSNDACGDVCSGSMSSFQPGSSATRGDSLSIPRLTFDPKQEHMRSMEFPDIMRKDSSGLHDFDEEEENFATRRAVVASGKHMGKKAASTITKTATGLTEMSISTISKTATGISEVSGLHHVVSPIAQGIKPVAKPIAQGISSGVSLGVQGISSGVSMGVQGISSGVSMGVQGISSGASMGVHGISSGVSMGVSAVSSGINGVSGAAHLMMGPSNKPSQSFRRSIGTENNFMNSGRPSIHRLGSELKRPPRPRRQSSAPPSIESKLSDIEPILEEPAVTVPPKRKEETISFPEQNVDVEGPSTGKKLTEDLDEIKDKMHEMTWNLFNDKLYVVKNPDACYFGDAKKPEKRRKTDVSKEIDKLMRVKQYSNSNPFVARVGLYVEPIIGSAYSFLCVFRAGFNVMTWRDPMLTFWLSVFCSALSAILFIFPWRIFLFGLGFFLVGPQNWVIRILREKGHLPPLPPRKQKDSDEDDFESGVPVDQPVFTSSDRQSGSKRLKNSSDEKDKVDPREVHRVVVPYSPLIYHRFYDWPPEPQYAQVKRDANDDARPRRLQVSTLYTGGGNSIVSNGGVARRSFIANRSMQSSATESTRNLQSLRNRRGPAGFNRMRATSSANILHGSSSFQSQPLLPASRRRLNTGDWQGTKNKGYKKQS